MSVFTVTNQAIKQQAVLKSPSMTAQDGQKVISVWDRWLRPYGLIKTPWSPPPNLTTCNFNYMTFQHQRWYRSSQMHLQQDVFTASDASPVQKPAVGWIYNTLIIAVCDNILFQSCNLISNLDDCLSRESKQRTRGKMCLLDGWIYLDKFPRCFFLDWFKSL